MNNTYVCLFCLRRKEVDYDEPKVILGWIKELQKKMADRVKELEGLL